MYLNYYYGNTSPEDDNSFQKEPQIFIMLTSAGGILALLQDNPDVKQGISSDEDIKLKVQLTQFALRKLDIVVDEFWAEISDSIQTIEVRRKSLISALTC